jgi:hypothetical protein
MGEPQWREKLFKFISQRLEYGGVRRVYMKFIMNKKCSLPPFRKISILWHGMQTL